jgi:hypothetical protein
MTKLQRIFRLAAANIADGTDEFSCHAITRVELGDVRANSAAVSVFRAAFMPTREESFEYGTNLTISHYGAWLGSSNCEVDKEFRVLALLFASQMARTGDF